MPTWWWLSFADPAEPKGRQFLGGAIVQAESFRDAVDTCWRLHINPGGEVQGFKVPVKYEHRIEPGIANRLLTKAEIEAFETKWKAH